MNKYLTAAATFNMIDAIRFLSKYIKKHKNNFILFYLGWIVDSFITVVSPIILAFMIDEIVYYKNLDTFLNLSIIFVIVSVFSCLLYFLIYTIHSYLYNMYTFDIKLDVFRHAQRVTAEFLSNSETGDIIKTLNDDTTECMHFLIRNIFHFSMGILRCLFYFCYIFLISMEAGAFALFIVPLSAIIIIKYSRQIRRQSAIQRQLYGKYTSWIFEILSGLKNIRLFTAEKTVSDSLIEKNKGLNKIRVKTTITNLTSDNIIKFINLVMLTSVFVLAGYLSYKNQITIGMVTVLIVYFDRLKTEIIELAHNNIDMSARITSIQRIHKFLSTKSEAKWLGNRKLHVDSGQIKFSNLHFKYPTSKGILTGADLSVESGEKIALVGKSGCGKTTISELLLGFYEPDEGSISIDGQDIKKCSLSSIRKNIGVVQQDVFVFDGTIKENLLIGNPKARDSEIWEACKNAHLDDFINGLPDGLETIIGKNGVTLSGGQKQRLSIARIYLKDAKILIFDEATSALDFETETEIHNTWKELLKDQNNHYHRSQPKFNLIK